jgi:hypothetical protein
MQFALAVFSTCAIVVGFADAAVGQQIQSSASTTKQPNTVDLRPNFTQWKIEPKSQGKRNTCSVCVTTSAFEYALSRRKGQGVPLSVEYLNWACNQVIGNTTEDRGQFFHDLLKGYEQHGICLDNRMPYEPEFKNRQPSKSARTNAKAIAKNAFQVNFIKPWSKEAGLTEEQFRKVTNVLGDGWPVCVGSSHSLLLVGYVDDDKAAGGGRFLVADSGTGKFEERTFEFVKDKIYDVFWVSVELPENKRGR